MLKNQFRILIIGRGYLTGPSRRYCKDNLQRRMVERELCEKKIEYALYERDQTGSVWVPIYRAEFYDRKKGSALSKGQRKKLQDEAINEFIHKWFGKE